MLGTGNTQSGLIRLTILFGMGASFTLSMALFLAIVNTLVVATNPLASIVELKTNGVSNNRFA